MTRSLTHRRALQSGATLIEVLVSILVFSFGILGAVALQAYGDQDVHRCPATRRGHLPG